MSQRPVIATRQTLIATALDLVGIIGLIVSLVIAVSAWSGLPDIIPVHFGLDGRPNGWGNKSIFWMFPFLNIVVFLSFTVLRRYPHTFNYPVKITPQNAEFQYQIAIDLLNWLKTEFVWLFVYIEGEIIRSSKLNNSSLNIEWLLVFLCFIFVTVGVYLYQASRAR
ncbi:DUF1648 domain-containing protein [Merismopedia glauca]|uniref:DUF1648 domain-containing protein n=1 Tax=Merismopedia glauca CCAP 1448/3 TaxID=1296344 RepID=A0A2T1C5C7_9CYAN|nr:DUF1648 domain-containing protein [Merismopedia glauca]PSB03347.1 hypothetical protein C7B64_08810 [Merismopedia glauca CCAP 1448/3]